MEAKHRVRRPNTGNGLGSLSMLPVGGAWSRLFRASHSDSGFSLVEVMVAILILSVALAGLTRGLTTALSSSKESERQTIAAQFAAGQIETLRAEGHLVDGVTEGDCGEDLPLYSWKQTVSPANLDGLHEVVVEVANSGQPVFELTTLLFEVPEDARDRKPQTRRGVR